MPAGEDPIVAWGVATRPHPGQTESGDAAVVMPFPGGALIAALDGLGHGPEAARAARIASQVLSASPGESLSVLFHRSHALLKQTRGAVMSLASIRSADNSLRWVGVGNVDGRLFSGTDGSSASILLLGGIVGYVLPPLTPVTLPISKGDTLVLSTDGVGALDRFPDLSGPPTELAKRILDENMSGNDDALVLVARYMGSP